MHKYINSVKSAALSKTARDTYTLFLGNIGSAFFGFLFTLFLARSLSLEDFGVFSAASNFIFLLASFTDLGTSSGIVRFVSEFSKTNDERRVDEYVKAGLITKTLATLALSSLIFVFSAFFAEHLFATNDSQVAVWVAIISITLIFPSYFTFVFQGQKKFLPSAITDVLYSGSRVFIMFLVGLSGYSLYAAFESFALALIPSFIYILMVTGVGFLRAKPTIEVYKKLLHFSGWLGVNKIISAFSGRLDIQMLATLASATVVGYYSVPARLGMFLAMFTGSYSSVLAPRYSSFENKKDQKKYLVKSTIALIPIVGGIVFWVIIARPFMLFLFGDKFLPSVGVFQALAIAYIPFVVTAPAASAIIYALKKPIYIGAFSFFEIAGIFLLNLFFIPRYELYGPVIAFGIVRMAHSIYIWSVVVRYYFLSKQ